MAKGSALSLASSLILTLAAPVLDSCSFWLATSGLWKTTRDCGAAQLVSVAFNSRYPHAMDERFIQLSGTIDETMFRNLAGAVNQGIQARSKCLTLLMSSRGGKNAAAHAAYNLLRSAPLNLTTWNMGIVGSAAVSIFCAGSSRRSVPNARFWLHCTDWNFANRDYDVVEVRAILAELEQDMRLNARILAANSNQSEEELIDQKCHKTTWLPEQALKNKFIHEIAMPVISGAVQLITGAAA